MFFVAAVSVVGPNHLAKTAQKLRNLLVSLVYGWLFFGAGKQVSEAFRESDLFFLRYC